jgi:hypothetical protein
LANRFGDEKDVDIRADDPARPEWERAAKQAAELAELRRATDRATAAYCGMSFARRREIDEYRHGIVPTIAIALASAVLDVFSTRR